MFLYEVVEFWVLISVLNIGPIKLKLILLMNLCIAI